MDLPRRIGRLGLVTAAAAAATTLMLATPPAAPPDPPPPGQMTVAPVIRLPDAPDDVLIPGEMGRSLSSFLAILEGNVSADQTPTRVWLSEDGTAYELAP